MIQTKVFNTTNKPDLKEKENVINFLFDNLQEYGDPRSDIEKAIDYALELAQSESLKREAEINRIIGESYFKLGKYEESLSYLEKFKDKAESYSRNDIFQLGFVYYKTQNFDMAAKTFSIISCWLCLNLL